MDNSVGEDNLFKVLDKYSVMAMQYGFWGCDICTIIERVSKMMEDDEVEINHIVGFMVRFFDRIEIDNFKYFVTQYTLRSLGYDSDVIFEYTSEMMVSDGYAESEITSTLKKLEEELIRQNAESQKQAHDDSEVCE